MIRPPARRLAVIVVALPALLLLAGGCPPRGSFQRGEMFGPASVRIHPTFTQWKDWTGDGRPDGIEAVVELLDQFGEPTRATGRAMFEVYEYRREFPEPRGRRVGGPWHQPLFTREEQEAHWNRAVRAYNVRLPMNVPDKRLTVVAVSFNVGEGEATAQGRLFDELILERR